MGGYRVYPAETIERIRAGLEQVIAACPGAADVATE